MALLWTLLITPTNMTLGLWPLVIARPAYCHFKFHGRGVKSNRKSKWRSHTTRRKLVHCNHSLWLGQRNSWQKKKSQMIHFTTKIIYSYIILLWVAMAKSQLMIVLDKLSSSASHPNYNNCWTLEWYLCFENANLIMTRVFLGGLSMPHLKNKP